MNRVVHLECYHFGHVSKMTRSRSRSIDFLLGSVIKLNPTHPKLLPIEHNRMFGKPTLKQSNIIEHLKFEHCMQQSNIKLVSSGLN